MKKLLLISTIAIAFLTGCAMTTPNASNDLDSVIASAQMKYDKAHKEMVAWGKTKSILEEAKKLAKTSPDKAMKLAKEAEYQAETALAQSAEYEKTWKQAVPQ